MSGYKKGKGDFITYNHNLFDDDDDDNKDETTTLTINTPDLKSNK